MKTNRIILASGSPRRLEILRAHGIEPEVVVAQIDEDELITSLLPRLSMSEVAMQVALHKARYVYDLLQAGSAGLHDTLILAADTLVVKEGVGFFGKPVDHADAMRMLQALCNSSHEVITGVALIEAHSGKQSSLADTSIVHFGNYSSSDIDNYLATEPPFDKAGSYAIQGMWSGYVTKLEGDLENVIGLPFYRLHELLRQTTACELAAADDQHSG
ncbi:MAG: Maf family protein [Coriobacteriia bacterium]|nr:Maf family protein [Coriobacteriia bacterium]